MLVYYMTDGPGSVTIRAEGFRDSPHHLGNRMEDNSPYVRVGVLVTDESPDIGDEYAMERPVVLAVDVPEKVFADHEFTDQASGCRESYIPAAVLNQYGPPKTVTVFQFIGSDREWPEGAGDKIDL
jgi:hypothetical protein